MLARPSARIVRVEVAGSIPAWSADVFFLTHLFASATVRGWRGPALRRGGNAKNRHRRRVTRAESARSSLRSGPAPPKPERRLGEGQLSRKGQERRPASNEGGSFCRQKSQLVLFSAFFFFFSPPLSPPQHPQQLRGETQRAAGASSTGQAARQAHSPTWRRRADRSPAARRHQRTPPRTAAAAAGWRRACAAKRLRGGQSTAARTPAQRLRARRLPVREPPATDLEADKQAAARRIWRRARPGSRSAPGRGAPSARTGLTKVVSTATCTRALATTSGRRSPSTGASRLRSRRSTFSATRAPRTLV